MPAISSALQDPSASFIRTSKGAFLESRERISDCRRSGAQHKLHAERGLNTSDKEKTAYSNSLGLQAEMYAGHLVNLICYWGGFPQEAGNREESEVVWGCKMRNRESNLRSCLWAPSSCLIPATKAQRGGNTAPPLARFVRCTKPSLSRHCEHRENPKVLSMP